MLRASSWGHYEPPPDHWTLLNSAVALCAQLSSRTMAKLKTCQINSLGGEILLAAQAKDEQKADRNPEPKTRRTAGVEQKGHRPER
jgi:hypothetical protein